VGSFHATWCLLSSKCRLGTVARCGASQGCCPRRLGDVVRGMAVAPTRARPLSSDITARYRIRRGSGAPVTSVDVELGLTALAAMLSPTALTFSVLALVLSERPGPTGRWFFAWVSGLTLLIGVVAAFVLGNAAAQSKGSSVPRTLVAISDVVAGVVLIVSAVHALRRPHDQKRTAAAVARMSKLS